MFTVHIADFKRELIEKADSHDFTDKIIELLKTIDRNIENSFDVNNCLIAVAPDDDRAMIENVKLIKDSIKLGLGKVKDDKTVVIGRSQFKILNIRKMTYVVMNEMDEETWNDKN